MLHYHGLPMTPELDMLRAFKGRHAMVSYSDPRQIEHAAEVCQSVTLDNGSFSAWVNKEPYDFDGYLEWASHWVKHPCVEWCVIPDIIDGDESDNDALLHAWPLSPAVSVPVFHLHESLDRLQRLIASYPRIALGSSGQYAEPGSSAWWARMAEVMDVACDAEGMPRAKIHGLRMLDPDHFSHLPLSSADSTNVARNTGMDTRWTGSYAPRSRSVRALILMDRIESHASARRWCRSSGGVQRNMELIG